MIEEEDERINLDIHSHEIAPWQELHDQVEVTRILERKEKLDDPRRIGLCEDVSFGSHVSELILLEHLGLEEGLHRVDLASVSFLDEPDLRGQPRTCR